MALRPVSELGLVDLTDLTSPDAGATAPAKPRRAGGAKRARPAAQSKQASRSAPTQRQPAKAQTSAPSPRRTRAKATTVARTGIVLATWTVAGVCGVALGRVAVRR
jgi:hypothetical protein